MKRIQQLGTGMDQTIDQDTARGLQDDAARAHGLVRLTRSPISKRCCPLV